MTPGRPRVFRVVNAKIFKYRYIGLLAAFRAASEFTLQSPRIPRVCPRAHGRILSSIYVARTFPVLIDGKYVSIIVRAGFHPAQVNST